MGIFRLNNRLLKAIIYIRSLAGYLSGARLLRTPGFFYMNTCIADSDLLPVIKSVQKHAPDKEIGVMFPITLTSFELRQNVAFRFKMQEKLLRACQFPDEVRIGSTPANSPESWS